MSEAQSQTRTTRRFDRRWLVLLGVFIALLLIVLAYCVSINQSYRKINPYRVTLTINVEESQRVFMGYDYGYGIQDRHIRPLDLNSGENELALSLSAWKPISAFYFIAPEATPYQVTQLSVERSGQTISPALPPQGPTLEGKNWLTRVPLTALKN